jgi:hypothetical protein
MKTQTTLTFHSALTHTDIGKHFCNYLKKQNKEETWKFIVATKLLEVLIQKPENNKRSKKQLELILNTYFDNRTRETHLKLQNTKENEFLFCLIADSKFEQNFELLYAPIITLKNTHLPNFEFTEFPKFVETPEAQKLCKVYEKNKELVLPVLSNVYKYKEEDFERKELRETDFNFFREIEKEDKQEWDEVHVSENVKIHQSFQNYLPRISFLELPQCVNFEMEFDCTFQEALCGVLHRYFEKDSICIFFQTIDYQKDYFIVEQYIQRPTVHVRVRRMICSLKYENGSIVGLMKPLKIPNLDFMKTSELKFFRKGKEIIEKGSQDFLYFGFRFIKLGENKTKLTFNALHQGVSKKLGSPKTLITMKLKQDYKTYLKGIQEFQGKRIADFSPLFNETKNGMPLDPFAKMLLDMNLDQYETYPVKHIKLVTIQNQPVKTKYVKIKKEKEILPEESIMDLISKSVNSGNSLNFLDGMLMENVSNSFLSGEKKEKKQKLDDFNLEDFANSERFMDLDTNCLSDILDFEIDFNLLDQFETSGFN